MPFVTFILGAFVNVTPVVYTVGILPPLVVIVHRHRVTKSDECRIAYNYPCWLIINII